MNKRRVLVLPDDSLLMAGVLSILREQPEVELTTVPSAGSDLDRHLREIVPHVVVAARAAMDQDSGVGLTRFLREHPGATLVALSLDRSELEVFRTRRVRRATLEELVSIVSGVRSKAHGHVAARNSAARNSAR